MFLTVQVKTVLQIKKKIIRIRFGLGNGRSHTLEEIGNVNGVTRERINQIEVKNIRKIRTRIRSRKHKKKEDL
ncbi:sigma factor-like helix-turn-helix DNA-binding protein [Neobacillus niacini]|uniref:sigma factor-like helix-turn-helix DNA-binding protein n=1 Tax=Neobacillus niacini TaxID=86668 RepID=UPI001D9A137A|nr:hypothetical protein [Neobacillus niacini]